MIRRQQGRLRTVFVAYADCGTGGRAGPGARRGYGIERLPGAHCYQFLPGRALSIACAAEEPGTFYLTDFLARHFDRLVVGPLGLDRHPELRMLISATIGGWFTWRRPMIGGTEQRPARQRPTGLGFESCINCGYSRWSDVVETECRERAHGQADPSSTGVTSRPRSSCSGAVNGTRRSCQPALRWPSTARPCVRARARARRTWLTGGAKAGPDDEGEYRETSRRRSRPPGSGTGRRTTGRSSSSHGMARWRSPTELKDKEESNDDRHHDQFSQSRKSSSALTGLS